MTIAEQAMRQAIKVSHPYALYILLIRPLSEGSPQKCGIQFLKTVACKSKSILSDIDVEEISMNCIIFLQYSHLGNEFDQSISFVLIICWAAWGRVLYYTVLLCFCHLHIW